MLAPRGRSVVTALAVAITGCGYKHPPVGAARDPLGLRIPIGAAELFFGEGVEPEAAQAVGEVLTREREFGTRPATAQVRYVNRRYEVRLVVRAGAEHTSPSRQWRALGEAVSRDCFRSSPVDVHLCDERMATLRVVPFEPIRPDLPVRATLRPAAGGRSLVAQYRNDTPRHLSVVVTVRNPTTGDSRTATVALAPHGVAEHGWAEGWPYRSGDAIDIAHADYETRELVVP